MLVDALQRMCITGVSYAPVATTKPFAKNVPARLATGIIIVRAVFDSSV